MKRILAVFILAFAMPLSAAADTLGFEAGVSLWGHGPSGDISYKGDNNDLEDDLGLKDKTELGLWASVEHPVPILPNLRVAYNQVSSKGDGTLTADFGDITATTNVDTDITLDQIDTTLYYEVMDNVVDLDLGLNVKLVNGNVKVTGGGTKEDQDFVAPIPMLYVSAGVDLPLTGLSVGGQGSVIAYGGNRLTDLSANLAYESPLGIGAEVGYRQLRLKVDDVSNVDLDATIGGPYGAIFYHF